MKRFTIIAVALVAAVPLTRLAAELKLASVKETIDERVADELDDAIRTITADFADIQEQLRSYAMAVAGDPNALFLARAEYEGREPPEEMAAAIANFQSRHSISGPVSLEVYGPDFSLRAWSGISILPRPERRPTYADTVAHIREDPFRRALVVWMPMAPRGWVRAAYAIETSAVENSFLGYDDLAAEWRKKTGHQLRVGFHEMHDADSTLFAWVPLVNQKGEMLATVVLSKTSGTLLTRDVVDRFDAAEAFWWMLLVAWLLAGLWVAVDGKLGARRTRTTGFLVSAASRLVILAGFRYALLVLEMPGRWFDDGQLSSVFNPVHLASEFGWGAAQSIGDLAVTSLFLLGGAVAVFDAAKRYRPAPSRRSRAALTVAGFVTLAGTIAVVIGHAELTRQSMIDTTLDFFAWTGLSPQPLVLIVFCSLLLSTIAALILGIAGLISMARWSNLVGGNTNRSTTIGALSAASAIAALLFVWLDLHRLIPWWALLLHMAALVWPAAHFLRLRPPLVRVLRIRSILVTILVSAVLLYPLLYRGMDEQRRLRLLDAASDFAASGDEQAVVGLRSVFEQMENSPEIAEITSLSRPLFPDDEVVQRLAAQYPISHMVPGIQRAHVALYDMDLRILASFEQDRQNNFLPTTTLLPAPEFLETAAVDITTGRTRIAPVNDVSTKETIGFVGSHRIDSDDPSGRVWIAISLDRRGVEAPFGAIFGYLDWRRSLSLAEFKEGRRVRSEGENFERYALPSEVEDRIAERGEVWQGEEVYGRAYVTYYRAVDEPTTATASGSIVAVRARAIIPYDHLYYLLRIAIAGLWLGLPAYLAGLFARWRMGLIPTRRRQYGDRVLDAFLIVGIFAVAGMGQVGQQVITRENDGAIKSRLERRLQRVEDYLIRVARRNEPLYEVQRRIPVDSLAEQLSLDLTVYHGPWLVESSTPISDAGPLMGYRLPAQAYDDLFIKRFRQSFVESSNLYGEVFTIGYKALPDDEGWPRSVVGVLTFPEQARIREERARTTAYFFGALLVLLLVIMATATTLATALTGPLRRLRDGMQSVAAGRVQKPIPVESADEVGQLVETFNLMQNQLSESRRKLAQQERELAWSEMARQVAHEIKNPLTPMKLSIQHLQRAYEEFDPADAESKSRFAVAFGRITKTVSEQIGTLADIANEFSTFARLPRRHVEVVNPNHIIGEAVKLTGAELADGIRFSESNEPVYVEADADELRRVVINLLKNAVQAVHDVDGSVEVHTRTATGLDVRPDVNVFVCEVVDNGPGIAPEVQSRIFQPNFSTKTSGMGLGLAISKKSIEAMGGEIGFTTDVGQGSTFWVRLPLVEA